MAELLCLNDVPYQCWNCKSHFPTENSLKLHCFVEGHERVVDRYSDTDCDCGLNPDEPHQCNSCRLIGISIEGCSKGESQLWKCTGCGMLYKCIECGLLFKGSGRFRDHLPRCNSIEDVLKRMKKEKNSDENESDVKENIAVKEEKYHPDVKYPIKQEISENIKEEKVNPDVKFSENIKEEKYNPDVKFPIKLEIHGNIKQEKDYTNSRLRVKRDADGNVKTHKWVSKYNLRRS